MRCKCFPCSRTHIFIWDMIWTESNILLHHDTYTRSEHMRFGICQIGRIKVSDNSTLNVHAPVKRIYHISHAHTLTYVWRKLQTAWCGGSQSSWSQYCPYTLDAGALWSFNIVVKWILCICAGFNRSPTCCA